MQSVDSISSPLVSHRPVCFVLKLILLVKSLGLMLAALAIGLVTLISGRFASSLQKAAILTFDTSAVNDGILRYLGPQVANSTSYVQDWYEVHYLSVCQGLWLGHNAAFGKNTSTTVCNATTGGYKFSLGDILADAAPAGAQPLFANWSYGSLATIAPFILLVLAITFAGLSIIILLISLRTILNVQAARRLILPRIGFFAAIAAMVLFTDSSAIITGMVPHLAVPSPDTLQVSINAWRGPGFYVLTWLAAGIMWIVMILFIILGYIVKREEAQKRLQRRMQRQQQHEQQHPFEYPPPSYQSDDVFSKDDIIH